MFWIRIQSNNFILSISPILKWIIELVLRISKPLRNCKRLNKVYLRLKFYSNKIITLFWIRFQCNTSIFYLYNYIFYVNDKLIGDSKKAYQENNQSRNFTQIFVFRFWRENTMFSCQWLENYFFMFWMLSNLRIL